MDIQRFFTQRRVDWLFSLACLWFVSGLYIDGWAHNHLESALESFFTPWHLIFYSGFGAASAILILQAWRSGWRVAPEYRVSVAGMILFSVGGAADLVWHNLIGIEASVEALLSPPHLFLATGGVLLVAGPLQRLYRRDPLPGSGMLKLGPEFVSLFLVFAFMTFMLQFLHPATHPWVYASLQTDNEFYGQALGMANIITHTTLAMGLILSLIRRFRFPFGSFTFLFGATTIAIMFMKDRFEFMLPAIIGGALVDCLYWKLRPHQPDIRALRLFAFFAPAAFYLMYTLTVISKEPTWWSTHLVTGQIVIAGLVGLLLSYISVPPQSQE
jgi:hypothetical protein